MGNALLTHTLASFWRKQSCQICVGFSCALFCCGSIGNSVWFMWYIYPCSSGSLHGHYIVTDELTPQIWVKLTCRIPNHSEGESYMTKCRHIYVTMLLNAQWLFLTIWWRHPMETFSALLAICAGNSPVPGEFPAQRPVTRSFDVFFDMRLNKRLSKQWWGWWFETLSRQLWRHCNELIRYMQCWVAYTFPSTLFFC